MIESVDDGIGRFMQTLNRLQLTDNTVVIFFSDNGGHSSVTNNAPLREGKQFLYEGGIRVPLVVKWPGHIKPGTTCDVPVISHDLFPTMMEMAGRDTADFTDLDGVSLLPLLTGSGSLSDRKLYWYSPHYARKPGSIVRDGDFKLIEHYDPPSVEMYNVGDDLSESHDLAGEMPKRVAAMRHDLDQWLTRINATRHTPNPRLRPTSEFR